MNARRWHVYLVRCSDGALYTGITTDLARRLAEHRRGGGRGARRLRGRSPLRLVASRLVGRRGLALKLEHRIKRLSKSRKEGLVGRPDRMEALLAEVRRAARLDRRPQTI